MELPALITSIAALIGALAWPLVALSIVFYFRIPIRKIFDLLPRKVAAASKFAVGSFSMEVVRQAEAHGGAVLAEKVGALTPAALEELVNTRRVGWVGVSGSYGSEHGDVGFTLPADKSLDGLRELESLGLIHFNEPLAGWLAFISSIPTRRRDLGTHDRSCFIFDREITPSERTRLEGQSYELTDEGRHALDAIIRAVAEQVGGATV